MASPKLQKGFTLVELLIVTAIVGLIALVVFMIINPLEFALRSRDANRISDINSLNSAVSLAQVNGIALPGSTSIIYISLPDSNLDLQRGACGNDLGLLPPASGTTYYCGSPSNYRNVDGTGWLPFNFSQIPGGAPFAALPIDPLNQSSTGSFYAYADDGLKYQFVTNLQSQKYTPIEQAQAGNGSNSTTFLYTQGTQSNLIAEDFGCVNGGPCVWVSDTTRIEEFDNAGVYQSKFGSAGSGNGQFGTASGLAVDTGGNIYVLDSERRRVQKFDSNGNYLLQFGSSGSGNGQFTGSPVGIRTDTIGNVYVVDTGNARVEKFDSNGNYLSQFGSSGSGSGQFTAPKGIVIDASGNIYVVDSGNSRVEKFDSSGNYLSQFGSSGSGNGQFSSPVGIAIDSAGNIYVVDTGNNRVQKFDSGGSYLSQFGSSGSGNGQFSSPNFIAIDANGRMYVTDVINKRVQEFSPTTTYMGQFGSSGTGNGQFFSGPYDVAVE